MNRQLPTPLSISHIISSDAPLSSPLSDSFQWDHHYSPAAVDTFGLSYPYYAFPPSPPHSVGSNSADSPMDAPRMLKSSSRMSPDGSEPEQLCLPTHQVFDFPAGSSIAASPSPEPSSDSLPIEQYSVPAKRPSPAASSSSSKKPRASGERITTKDFIPPDVSGLSKREARLVKNRAAAFLSRQRKREEFENMEVRVAELEQENARLQALAQGSGHAQAQAQPDDSLLSEVEQLRAQLAEAQRRETELNDALSRKAAAAAAVKQLSTPIKTEVIEPQLSMRSTSARSEKSGASLGLMVLLCALPTLLSMPSHSTFPTTFSFPLSGTTSSLPATSSAFDINSFVPSEYDWSFNSGAIMDLDVDEKGRVTTASSSPAGPSAVAQKLEFVDSDSEALGLSGLDISFDATPSSDGKIRVRIHPPSSTVASAASSASCSSAPSPAAPPPEEDAIMWGGNDFFSPPAVLANLPGDADRLGPFLDTRIGGGFLGSGFAGMDMADAAAFPPFGAQSDFDTIMGGGPSSGSGAGAGAGAPGRRRVRIALKSMPGSGREGGEWEVELC